ncbi:voltage-dependent calcium channel subunit alpha-2/delta-2-like isoform X3 [Physella acuta]|uniref:voltage-dependent calcium channel subunit alpha-2/delta-2-like isoform X3 n=1 Tax=Physella acuta TaxID=109671 RepID=UPI0027DBF440|nr:voltage-dependent calcium channel subunit alpha-2/delta-2-like isoform X3 [Physella acuta]
MDTDQTPTQFIKRFNKNVNISISSVHIPVEIYDGDIDILNGLNWSAALDEQFIDNFNSDPEILWQYFGSQTGFMRTFPAAQWPLNGVDLYDVRRQSWYTQGSSSPKDMIILIDRSGSTHGQSLQLMQNAVKSILDTLGENDFVNIISFSETPDFVTKCFNQTRLVQANFRNKKLLAKGVSVIDASGQADFSEAMKFALTTLKEFANSSYSDDLNTGAKCNKVIMLLTDGGTDTAEAVFKALNWPEKEIRVFTYAVGPTPNPIHAIRWMACANRGYFSQIPAMGAIRSRVQDYEEVLSRPLALGQAEHIQWTSSHEDTFFDPENLSGEYIPVLSRPQVIQNKKTFEWGNIYMDHMGLGMMTTVTLPVYNRSLSSTNQTILGVMGIDVTTKTLSDKTPIEKIGPNGYSFAINPNGYVVFHPNLQTTGKYTKEPPNIDILELEIDEGNQQLEQLREDMINNTSNSANISTLFLSEDQRYVTHGEATYSFTPIVNTTFSIAIVIPTYQKKYPSFTTTFKMIGNTLTKWNDALPPESKVFIAPWDYMRNKTKPQTINLTGTIDDIIKLLETYPNESDWNVEKLYHLYYGIKFIDPKSVPDFKKLNKNPFFVMTNGGLTFVYPSSKASYFENNWDPRNSSLYKRALFRSKCIFMAEYTNGERSNSSSHPYVVSACPVEITEKNKTLIDKAAVVGDWLTHDQVLAKMKNATSSGSPDVMTCEDGNTLACYLVDDGGFLVAANIESPLQQIGRFFGEVDPAIFNKLNGTVFFKAIQHDFQATCPVKKDEVSAGFRSFTVPTLNLLFDVLSAGWWTSKVSWLYASFNLYSWLFSPAVEVYAKEESNDRACVIEMKQFYINNSMPPYTDSADCGNCTRNFTSIKLPESNLLLIVSTVCPHCEGLYPIISQSPSELSQGEEEELICRMAQNPRMRARSYKCYHKDVKENTAECGCGSLKVSYLSVFGLIILTFQLFK